MPFSQSCRFSEKCQLSKKRFTAPLLHCAPFMGWWSTENEKLAQK